MLASVSVCSLEKSYPNGFKALDNIDLEVKSGEIFALLGPNGAGKTTLINAICGILKVTSGNIKVSGYDNIKDYRLARSEIGLVPQELTTDAFETVWNTVSFSRGLFGKSPNASYIETLLKDLSLWDKQDSQIRMLSGGMKRRVMIAKALSHEPSILFLDEPTAGVDVELRKSMWKQVRSLQAKGVTIILTTHYLEEAEEMADRIGIINKGKIVLIEDKQILMKKLGTKELILDLVKPIQTLPDSLSEFHLYLSEDGQRITYAYDPAKQDNGVFTLIDRLKENSIQCRDLNTQQSSLEDIFVKLVGEK